MRNQRRRLVNFNRVTRRLPSPPLCAMRGTSSELLSFLIVDLLVLASLPSLSLSVLPTESLHLDAANATEFNVSRSKLKEDSFADMIDRALEKEFPENEQSEGFVDLKLCFSFTSF